MYIAAGEQISLVLKQYIEYDAGSNYYNRDIIQEQSRARVCRRRQRQQQRQRRGSDYLKANAPEQISIDLL